MKTMGNGDSTVYSNVSKKLDHFADEMNEKEGLYNTLLDERSDVSIKAMKAEALQTVKDISGWLIQSVQAVMSELFKDGPWDSNEDHKKQLHAGWTKLDDIDRARFFFTWIAVSITYDERVIKDEGPLGRTVLQALHGEKEVCIIIASLFKQLFNDTTVQVSGSASNAAAQVGSASLSEVIGGAMLLEKEGVRTRGEHAWNSFPIQDQTGRTQMKVIDVTNGVERSVVDGKEYKSKTDYSWFTRSNEDFSWDHIRDGEYTPQRGREQDASMIPLRPIINPKPKVSAEHRNFIDFGSLKPDLYQFTATGKFTISFSEKCAHFDVGGRPAYAIRLGQEKELRFRYKTKEDVIRSVEVDFSKQKGPSTVELICGVTNENTDNEGFVEEDDEILASGEIDREGERKKVGWVTIVTWKRVE